MYITNDVWIRLDLVLLHEIDKIRDARGMSRATQLPGLSKPDFSEIKKIHQKYWRNIIRIPGRSSGFKRKELPEYDPQDTRIPRHQAERQREKFRPDRDQQHVVVHTNPPGHAQHAHTVLPVGIENGPLIKDIYTRPDDSGHRKKIKVTKFSTSIIKLRSEIWINNIDESYCGMYLYVKSNHNMFQLGKCILWANRAKMGNNNNIRDRGVCAVLQAKEKNCINSAKDCDKYEQKSLDVYYDTIKNDWTDRLNKLSLENGTEEDLKTLNVFRLDNEQLKRSNIIDKRNIKKYKDEALHILYEEDLPIGCLQDIAFSSLIRATKHGNTIIIDKFPAFDELMLDEQSTMEAWVIYQNDFFSSALEIIDNETRLKIARVWKYFHINGSTNGITENMITGVQDIPGIVAV